MEPAPHQSRVLKFGVFEVDLEAGELRKSGLRLRLAGYPFQVLRLLLEHPLEIVTREELQKRIWPQGTYIDCDLALKKAVNRLREVLGDSAESPRFIETIPRRGYRFITPVNRNGVSDATPEVQARIDPWPRRAVQIGFLALLAVTALVIAVLGAMRSDSWRHLFAKTVAPQIRSIAVLPLQNLSIDPEQEYFSDGMTDALITNLAQIGSLKVISRTSSMKYKKTEKALPEIARELNVDGIVEGTVQRSGDHVRITAQLIHGPSDTHLWANSYERELRDVFTLERDIAGDIVNQVRVQITRQDKSSVSQPRPLNLNSLDLYLQGKYHLNKAFLGPRDGELRRAGELFQRAIDADPAFAFAYIGLAEAHHNLLSPSAEDFSIMKEAAEKAAALDLTSSDAREEIGVTKWNGWDWSGAEEDFRRAIALNPNNADAHDALGDVLDVMGRLEEGWKEHELAQELDPARSDLAWALYRRGEYDRAAKLLRSALESRPEDPSLRWLLSEIYAQEGMKKEWLQELAKCMTLLGYGGLTDRLKREFASSGYRGSRRQWAKELERLAVTKEVYAPGVMAQVYVDLGDKDRAFYWLGEGINHHYRAISDPVLQWTKIDPGLANLHADPRFKDVLHRMGLPL